MVFQWRCYKFICHNLLYAALLVYLYMPSWPHTGAILRMMLALSEWSSVIFARSLRPFWLEFDSINTSVLGSWITETGTDGTPSIGLCEYERCCTVLFIPPAKPLLFAVYANIAVVYRCCTHRWFFVFSRFNGGTYAPLFFWLRDNCLRRWRMNHNNENERNVKVERSTGKIISVQVIQMEGEIFIE